MRETQKADKKDTPLARHSRKRGGGYIVYMSYIREADFPGARKEDLLSVRKEGSSWCVQRGMPTRSVPHGWEMPHHEFVPLKRYEFLSIVIIEYGHEAKPSILGLQIVLLADPRDDDDGGYGDYRARQEL